MLHQPSQLMTHSYDMIGVNYSKYAVGTMLLVYLGSDHGREWATLVHFPLGILFRWDCKTRSIPSQIKLIWENDVIHHTTKNVLDILTPLDGDPHTSNFPGQLVKACQNLKKFSIAQSLFGHCFVGRDSVEEQREETKAISKGHARRDCASEMTPPPACCFLAITDILTLSSSVREIDDDLFITLLVKKLLFLRTNDMMYFQPKSGNLTCKTRKIVT